MFFKTRNSVKILNVDLDLSAMPSMRSAKLISIFGSGQLKKQIAPLEDERYAYHHSHYDVKSDPAGPDDSARMSDLRQLVSGRTGHRTRGL